MHGSSLSFSWDQEADGDGEDDGASVLSVLSESGEGATSDGLLPLWSTGAAPREATSQRPPRERSVSA
ncbi:hypothetical protein [Streptomyces sp. RKAG337]|uniref:hypothetical protein n=1 Tax=Streptomyces sp. RKAG337 TaxID=2893404 RepID=UPI0020342367|nr:hypothetical protein [Streptomyces sp. RKAG337]MCM2430885.1 hypothetical protein [Streptomyces sp. RKAG337]